MPVFSHLHCHTQFSLLDGAASIPSMMKKAKADNMPAIAMTDHGNMFGAFDFVAQASKVGIKPIVGCEFYMVEDRHRKQFSKEDKDHRYHQLLLAKNKEGYQNLSKLCSLGYTEGLYSKWPRIDKELVLKYHKGLIATTCCLGAQVPQAILKENEQIAEDKFVWWLDLFGPDYYVELQRHGLGEQEKVNQVLLRFAKKYNVKIICSNDSHYTEQADSAAHDILLCVNTGELRSTPVWKEEGSSPRGYRFGFPNEEFYFKTTKQMGKVFEDLPESLDNTNEIVDKIDTLKLTRDILLPNYPLPPGFSDADVYLEHLAFEGARRRYNGVALLAQVDTKLLPISTEVSDRVSFELKVIKEMGFAGYFLIVQDFINAGRQMGVAIGPGRGSAAGSAVAYCVGITNIDPIKYNLLFERFLNPERVSMPDIDTDFDDLNRGKVIDYVVNKYGQNQVAQIITYGSMAAKSAIKDVARAMDMPLSEANILAKMIPEKPGTTLDECFSEIPELAQMLKGNDLRAEVLQLARKLEGSVRNTGVHASAVIIAPDELTNYIPVCVAKDSQLLVTQFDGKVIESAGMLKMDFLGLKTLTIMKDAVFLIEKNHGITIDLDTIDLEDQATFELYQRGDTVGTFQFESEGMRMHLKDLKPNNIEDLIAMNALYRPGPMQFIPNYINRKQNREPVEYPHELLKPILEYTFGIMVYQEQIMQTAQILAGYSLGGADLLRRAMGKKDKAKMALERIKFVEGAGKLHQIPEKKADEVFSVMERFAEYGFNRSHSAAYSVVAYQTAYLKANYPAEFMASVLNNSMSNIEKLTFFLEECQKMKIQVLGPEVNESSFSFDVNAKGQIRFGLGAIKGTGDAAVESIIQERKEKGVYTDIFDFVSRQNLKSVTKKTFENLALAGAFDNLGIAHRAQLLAEENGSTFLDKIIRYGAARQDAKISSQQSLFGDSSNDIPTPKLPNTPIWPETDRLKKEKSVVGFYISGHPLDIFRPLLNKQKICSSAHMFQMREMEICLAGIVCSKTLKTSKSGSGFAIVQIEDYDGTTEIRLMGKDYDKFIQGFELDNIVLVRGKMQESYGRPDQYEFKIQKLEVLDASRITIGKIVLEVEAVKINADFNQRLRQISIEFAGAVPLSLHLNDAGEKLDVKLVARKASLRMCPELEQAIKKRLPETVFNAVSI